MNQESSSQTTVQNQTSVTETPTMNNQAPGVNRPASPEHPENGALAQETSTPPAAPPKGAESVATLLPTATVAAPTAPAEGGATKITIPASLGTVEYLSEAEQAQLFACESVIESGWSTFVQVGLALAQIRDNQLYRNDYPNFDTYCRAKWEYTRAYAYHLISAAQVFTYLSTNCRQRKPEHEGQLRPLMGLTPEQAKSAWERAVAKAGKGRITERLVKAAVKELQIPSVPAPVSVVRRKVKTEQRQLIDSTLGELLVLVSQKAPHEVLATKLEALHGHIHDFLAPLRRG